MRALSRDRNFTLLWVGQTLSDVGSQVTTIALPLLVLALTGSAAKAGLVGVARMIALPIVSLPAGVIADRCNRRHVMIVCAAGRLLAIASVAVALEAGRPPLGQLMAVALIDAGLSTLSMVAERGLIGEVVPDALYSDAVAVNEGRSAAAYTAGPPLGGAMFGLARALPFVVDAVSFLAALELLGLLIARHHGASASAIGGAFAVMGAGGLLGAVVAGPLRRRVSTRVGVLAEL